MALSSYQPPSTSPPHQQQEMVNDQVVDNSLLSTDHSLSLSSSSSSSPQSSERIPAMGSLAAHMAGFLFLFPIGIRQLLSSYSHYLRSPSPSHFFPKPWYFSSPPPPSTSSSPNPHHHNHYYLVGNLDLYALLIALPIAAFSEIFLFLTLPTTAVSANLNRLPLSHSSASLALFWLLLLSLSVLTLPDDLAFLLSALAFLAELLLTSDAFPPAASFEARAYSLVTLLTGVCAATCLAMAVRGRGALAADVGLSAAMVLKGTWLVQVGVLLYGWWTPSGCGRRDEGAAVECELEEDRLRAVALVDLLFVVHATAVAVGCVALFWAVARSSNRTAIDAEIMRPMMMSDFEMLD